MNALRLHLIQEETEISPLPLDILGENGLALDPKAASEGDGDLPTTQRDEPEWSPTPQPLSTNAPVTTHPVDGYILETDEGGDADDGRGGLEARRTAKLRRPGGSGGGGGAGNLADQHSRRSTEQRAVDLLRLYVLDPEGISITDQRLRPKVGADLVGDDGIFRELKAHSGVAPNDISLTEHEFLRAGNRGNQYELVIVKDVWDTPSITNHLGSPSAIGILANWGGDRLALEGVGSCGSNDPLSQG